MTLRNLVAGEWIDGTGPEQRDENPSRPQETVATWRAAGSRSVVEAVAAARTVAPSWAATPIHDRAAVLLGAASRLEAAQGDLGVELSREEGKTLAEGTGEVARAARILRYFAAEADRDLGELYGSPRAGEHIWTRRVPVGPVALITPWNFPIAIPAWKVAPALVFGNPVVWKPSPVTPLLAVRLAEALVEAGLPAGALNLVMGGAETAQALLSEPGIRACSFTGSTGVGRAVAKMAVDHDVKVQAEKGGVNAAVVLADADLDLAAGHIVSGAMGSTGQRCSATSRVVVERGVHDELLERVVQRCRSLVVGDALDPATDVGPVATPGQLEVVRGALAGARSRGARVLVDGDPATDPSGGYFVGPSVVAGVGADDPMCAEEIFGPVLAVVEADGPEAALAAADHGPFGLTASVFTADLGSALRATDRLEVGVLHVNSETTGADPHVPFGGVKGSGSGGREMGRAGRDFYTEVRTVYLAPPPHTGRGS